MYECAKIRLYIPDDIDFDRIFNRLSRYAINEHSWERQGLDYRRFKLWAFSKGKREITLETQKEYVDDVKRIVDIALSV